MKLILLFYLFPMVLIMLTYQQNKKSNRSNQPVCGEQIILTLFACRIPCLLLYFSLALRAAPNLVHEHEASLERVVGLFVDPVGDADSLTLASSRLHVLVPDLVATGQLFQRPLVHYVLRRVLVALLVVDVA